jgi:hypothetical protein
LHKSAESAALGIFVSSSLIFAFLNWTKMEPPAKKPRKLLDDDSSSDSGDESGGVPITDQSEPAFKINEEYARRFEHNKKREELQKCKSALLRSTTVSVTQSEICYSGVKIRKDFSARETP